MPDVAGTALVTAVGGDIGWSVTRILRQAARFERLVGCDITSNHAAATLLDTTAVVPRGDDPPYLESLAELIRREGVTHLIPISEPEIERIHRAAEAGWAPAMLVMPAGQAIPIGLDKLETARFVRGLGLPAPWTVPLEAGDPPEFPCVLKDRRGWGSRNVVIIPDREALRLHAAGRARAVLQQLIGSPDDEYTCGLFRDRAGTLRTIVFRRVLRGGITASGVVVDESDIEEALRVVADGLDLRGSINVQLRRTPQGPTIFEINPRFSSTVMFRDLLGFRDVLWAIDDLAGRPVPAYRPPVGTRVYRVFTEVVAAAARSAVKRV